MKKTFITLIVLLSTLNLNAQFSLDAKANLGLNGISRLRPNSYTDFVEFSAVFSYNLGLSGAIILWQKGEFVTDILYFDKHTKIHWLFGMSDGNSDYNISFKYLSIPCYFRFNPKNKFYVDLGYVSNIYLGHKVGKYDEVKANTYTGGILFGFEYQIYPKINIAVNAQTDIMSFADELIETAFEGDNYYYNYNLMFSVSYRIFPQKKK